MLKNLRSNPRLLLDDCLLIGIMAVLAACGLIYEYLLSHYSARVLGSMETVIYAMIGIMIVAMGLGAFAAKKIKDPYLGFAWLEVSVALIGCGATIFLASLIGFTQYLPQIIADTFAIPVDMLPLGGMFESLVKFSLVMPYVFGFLLGFLIGMEIPLIARIREDIYGKHLSNNVGTIYGADYIGAGVGAAIWVIVMLKIEINQAAALTASLNLVAGVIFFVRYRGQIKTRVWLVISHLILALMIFMVYCYGGQWSNKMQDLLYLDKVVHQQQTRFQNLVFTRRDMSGNLPSAYSFYINGRLQFSSMDEQIYHQMLVHPAMSVSARHNKVLIIGGGDGLALREVLKWPVESVKLVDLDDELVDLFQYPERYLPDDLSRVVMRLTQNAFNDSRVSVVNSDAFVEVDSLLQQGALFDTIIVDLPDPSHPDLNKLYSKHFYARLRQLLYGDGAIVVQSTSPFHAKQAFISIGKTLAAAGFSHTEQYHQNVPSFGEWGWSIATKMGAPASVRAQQQQPLFPFELTWLNAEVFQAALVFPADYYRQRDQVLVNELGTHTLYQYHHQAWQSEMGLEIDTTAEK
ncbi:polyamine aminopropyltransferase [Motilimonas sp. 1_MG-2023]|uniref:polyamine aminopropyltransferase n=1 Tax=Motilimonas sp. 1_MG-2023 TaxID=3062672 RepID=UPI0026E21985|nr:polyamine aminopropyltransferase [Motilimonas sp. 1_MG-2023]MDO6524742.1 polyamine aminopropyltransferase [Motilimonas sp. 1_MG-2023]